MCGIAGFLGPAGLPLEEADRRVRAMGGTLGHRGPDDHGTWMDAEAGIALAHQRLAIIDVSQAGHQPMLSPSGRFVMVFNGEIYNHRDLRQLLQAKAPRSWRGHSDTETLLSAFEEWGVEQTLQRSAGMFALALWDRERRTLTLARDRIGEKPLYYGWQGTALLFGSELKALRAHPEFRGSVDPAALPLYLRCGYIPAPWSIWQGIRKLLPGTTVSFVPGSSGAQPEPVPYWSLREAIRQGRAEAFKGSEHEALDTFERLLRQSVAGQMISDVPLGAFLSGGIDSSAVVAIMQSISARPIKTFTIGFQEQGYDEAKHARAVAAHLGTDHTELYVDAGQARSVVPDLPSMFDEPFGDASAIPTYLVSRLARKHVTVALTGDGGDELLGGYRRYARSQHAWRLTRAVPAPVRHLASGALRSYASRSEHRLAARNTVSPALAGRDRFTARTALLADLWGCSAFDDFYRTMTSHWRSPPLGQHHTPVRHALLGAGLERLHPLERMMAMDMAEHLPDDILAKVDRAAMAVSLESRLPLLDHRIVEFVSQLPLRMKVRSGTGKWLLRQMLFRHVPRQLVERPKQGFGVPIDAWIRGPLREWAEDLLDDPAAGEFLDPLPIRRRWQQHLAGTHNWRDSLWLVLMFHSWLRSAKRVA